MTPHIIITERQQRQRDAKLVLASIAACLSVAYAAHTIAGPQPLPQPDPRIERLLQAACRLPQHEGEATTYAVADGKLFCWRMK